MEARKNLDGNLHRYAKSILISVVIGELLTMVLLFVFAFVMCKVDLPPVATEIGVIAAASLGGLATGFFCGGLLKERGLVFGALCGGIMILILLLFHVGFRQFSSFGMLFLKYLTILLGSSIGGVLGVNRKGKRVKY